MHLLRRPMIDFSSTTDFPSFSFRFLANNSSAISPIVSRSRLRVLFCPVGKFWRTGRTGPIRNTKREIQLVSSLENDSKTSTTGESFPSNARKSWPKPAIPTESRLKFVEFRKNLRRNSSDSRDVVHPESSFSAHYMWKAEIQHTMPARLYLFLRCSRQMQSPIWLSSGLKSM